MQFPLVHFIKLLCFRINIIVSSKVIQDPCFFIASTNSFGDILNFNAPMEIQYGFIPPVTEEDVSEQ